MIILFNNTNKIKYFIHFYIIMIYSLVVKFSIDQPLLFKASFGVEKSVWHCNDRKSMSQLNQSPKPKVKI